MVSFLVEVKQTRPKHGVCPCREASLVYAAVFTWCRQDCYRPRRSSIPAAKQPLHNDANNVVAVVHDLKPKREIDSDVKYLAVINAKDMTGQDEITCANG